MVEGRGREELNQVKFGDRTLNNYTETVTLIIFCSFLLKEKNQKFKAANKSLKFYFIPLQKKNSSRLNVKSIERDSDSFFCLTCLAGRQALHSIKFFNAIYLRPENWLACFKNIVENLLTTYCLRTNGISTQ